MPGEVRAWLLRVLAFRGGDFACPVARGEGVVPADPEARRGVLLEVGDLGAIEARIDPPRAREEPRGGRGGKAERWLEIAHRLRSDLIGTSTGGWRVDPKALDGRTPVDTRLLDCGRPCELSRPIAPDLDGEVVLQLLLAPLGEAGVRRVPLGTWWDEAGAIVERNCRAEIRSIHWPSPRHPLAFLIGARVQPLLVPVSLLLGLALLNRRWRDRGGAAVIRLATALGGIAAAVVLGTAVWPLPELIGRWRELDAPATRAVSAKIPGACVPRDAVAFALRVPAEELASTFRAAGLEGKPSPPPSWRVRFSARPDVHLWLPSLAPGEEGPRRWRVDRAGWVVRVEARLPRLAG